MIRLATLPANVAVFAILIVSIALAAACRPATAWARAARSLLFGCACALVIAGTVLEAGTIYWSTVQWIAAVLLPLSVVFLAVAWSKQERRSVIHLELGAAVTAGACLILAW